MLINKKTIEIVKEIQTLTRSLDFNAEKIAEVRRLLRTISKDDPNKEQITEWIEESIWLTEGVKTYSK